MNRIMHNIIGDIHGQSVWKSLVRDECINVFVGDFFDPYSYALSYDDCKQNFLDIIDYKKAHPETVILYSNHELHYLLREEIGGRYSRYDYQHASEIQQLLQHYASYFNGIAYSVNNQYLVTHAGVSRYWYYANIEPYINQTPDDIAVHINRLWEINHSPFITNSAAPYQSPVWIRPWTLENYNLFEGTSYKQIYGHTPRQRIEKKNGLIGVDCLRSINQIGLENASFRILQP